MKVNFVQFNYFNHYNNYVYYASAADDPDFSVASEVPVGHAIIQYAIIILKNIIIIILNLDGNIMVINYLIILPKKKSR